MDALPESGAGGGNAACGETDELGEWRVRGEVRIGERPAAVPHAEGPELPREAIAMRSHGGISACACRVANASATVLVCAGVSVAFAARTPATRHLCQARGRDLGVAGERGPLRRHAKHPTFVCMPDTLQADEGVARTAQPVQPRPPAAALAPVKRPLAGTADGVSTIPQKRAKPLGATPVENAAAAAKCAPEHAPRFVQDDHPVLVEGLTYDDGPDAPRPWKSDLDSEARNARIKFLPAVLQTDDKNQPTWLVTVIGNDNPFGGGIVYIVSESNRGDDSIRWHALEDGHVGNLFARCRAWTPGHCTHADVRFGSMLWTLKSIFVNLEWETPNCGDIEHALQRASQRIVARRLLVPPAPPHIRSDLALLTCRAGMEDAPLQQLDARKQTWTAKRSTWTPPPGKWPSYPHPVHDGRLKVLADRAALATALNRLIRKPLVHGVATLQLGAGLAALSKLPSRCAESRPADRSDEDEEDAETKALLAHPKQDRKKGASGERAPKKKKKAQPRRGSIFAYAKRFIDDAAEVGSVGSGEGASSESDFIASEDDVEEGRSSADAKERARRTAARRRRDSVSGSDDDSEGDDASENSESQESEAGSDDAGSAATDSNEDEDGEKVVEAKPHAGSPSDESDDEDDDRQARSPSNTRLGTFHAPDAARSKP